MKRKKLDEAADLLRERAGGTLDAAIVLGSGFGGVLRDRIDATIAHEYEELCHGGVHAAALKAAAKTKLPISGQARRINRARAR